MVGSSGFVFEGSREAEKPWLVKLRSDREISSNENIQSYQLKSCFVPEKKETREENRKKDKKKGWRQCFFSVRHSIPFEYEN